MHVVAERYGVTPESPNAPLVCHTTHRAHGHQDFLQESPVRRYMMCERFQIPMHAFIMLTWIKLSSDSRRFNDIESRLAAVERELHHNSALRDASKERHRQLYPENAQELRSPVSTLMSTPAIPTTATSPFENDAYFALPPPDQVSALVDSYFANYNQAMPLFHQPLFMQILRAWYRYPDEHNEASWASINVVLALSLQQTPSVATASDDHICSTCIRNAQSVLNHLVIRDEDLQGLQVVLGLVILFLGTSHPQPACVLIATAVKLAHRLKLHLQEGRHDVNHELAAQKERLLWITYILDRDISLRTVEPYGLQDHDMEVDIQARTTEVSAGSLSLPGEQS